jgi:hypothetical protein
MPFDTVYYRLKSPYVISCLYFVLLNSLSNCLEHFSSEFYRTCVEDESVILQLNVFFVDNLWFWSKRSVRFMHCDRCFWRGQAATWWWVLSAGCFVADIVDLTPSSHCFKFQAVVRELLESLTVVWLFKAVSFSVLIIFCLPSFWWCVSSDF